MKIEIATDRHIEGWKKSFRPEAAWVKPLIHRIEQDAEKIERLEAINEALQEALVRARTSKPRAIVA